MTEPTEAEMLATIEAHGEEPKAPAAEPDKPAETEDEPGDEPAAPETPSEGAKPKKSAAERITELNAKFREAERENDRLKGQIEALSRSTPKPEPAAQTETPASDGAPNPDEYVYGAEDLEYITDLATHRAILAMESKAANKAAKDQAEAVVTTHSERVKAFAAKHPDFDEVVVEGAKAKTWLCTQTMNDAIIDSEEGPAVAYHLASNPDEAARIAALSQVAQIREIGKLEAKLAAPAANPAPAAKTITSAPDPAPVLRGSSGQFKVAADTSDFGAFDKAY